MIMLYQFPGAWGLSSLSPFCIKVETYLRLTGLPYETRTGDSRKAPKGKLPYIEDDGTVVADSTLVIEHLKRRHGDPLDQDLDAAQRATGRMVQRMLEEGTYFSGLWSRWADPENWPGFSEVIKPMFPRVIGPLLLAFVRSQVIKSLEAQGTGRHSREQIYAMGRADLEALAALLENRPFLLGDEPTSFDATAYAFVANLVRPTLPRGMLAADHPARVPLQTYRKRIEGRLCR